MNMILELYDNHDWTRYHEKMERLNVFVLTFLYYVDFDELICFKFNYGWEGFE